MKISGRYNRESYKARGSDTIPSDLVEHHSRKINGKPVDFSRVRWANGAVTVTAYVGGLTTVLHEWTSEPRPDRPKSLPLAVHFDGRGWKTYNVTGTRHAYYTLRKIARSESFTGARLQEPMGEGKFNVLALTPQDILTNSAKYACLLDRSNTHYDLER